MRIAGLIVICSLLLAGCGATTRPATSAPATSTAAPPYTVTSLSVVFITQDEGKDKGSAVVVQLLDNEARLLADATVADTKFDAHTVSQPVNLVPARTLNAEDLDRARLRLRLTPAGRDTWTFDLRLTAALSGGTQQNYFWSGLKLDEKEPEKAMPLSSGRVATTS